MLSNKVSAGCHTNDRTLTTVNILSQLDNDDNATYTLPFYLSKVQAGFPSPTDDHLEFKLNLNEQLIKHPAATFIVQAQGDSMKNAGIHSGDWLIVDRSILPTHDKIVIAAINGELTVKRLSKLAGRVQLLPDNTQYTPIDITEEQELVIWGVVTYVIHQAT